MSDYDAVIAAVGDAGIDILANNAGNAGPEGFNFAPFSESQPADWDRYFKVNLFGVMNCTRAVLPVDDQPGAGVASSRSSPTPAAGASPAWPPTRPRRPAPAGSRGRSRATSGATASTSTTSRWHRSTRAAG